jgi:hypothetical protein
MSKHVAPHQAVAGGAGRGVACSRTVWLTRGQVALRVVQLGLLGAILLGSSEATRLLIRDHRGQKLLLGALILTAGVLGAHLLGCIVLNRLAPPGEAARRVRRRVLSWLLEAALLPMFYLPVVLALFIGPPVIRVMGALAQP